MRLNIFALLAIAALLAVPMAGAGFVPTSFGFPTMFQNTNNAVFSQSVGTAWDLESLDFAPFGTMGLSCPVISQNGVQGQAIEATEFAQSTTVSAFTYPAITTGLSGFGDFTGFTGFL